MRDERHALDALDEQRHASLRRDSAPPRVPTAGRFVPTTADAQSHGCMTGLGGGTLNPKSECLPPWRRHSDLGFRVPPPMPPWRTYSDAALEEAL